ncbi:MAG TPA: DMT family transporter [Thiotrichaceae bacterium]|nr:DMT family transporter [Thiotrichaceae bacterium]HIM08152.1 DMT family transporter [Gammaproteobacteria bacterium]
MSNFSLKIIFCTSLALLAFSGNSILCRLALGDNAIDAANFTTIRLLSGIIVLMVILKLTKNNNELQSKGSWGASSMLFLYAITFSFAYISLATGVGALILFGAVQITMILASLISGNKLHCSEWIGVLVAFTGFVYLVIPSLSTPSATGFLLMTIAGIAWGIYTLIGRGSKNPLSDTAYNFLRTLPFVAILIVVSFQDAKLSQEGILLTILSGGIASGVGYTIWYIALGGLSVTDAAVVQLLVPVIAAIGGVLFANEMISLRLVLSSSMILGGILIVFLGRDYIDQLASNRT